MTSGLTTADYALIVSLCSAAVSLASLGWNVWSKFIYPKPKVRASVAMMTVLDHPQTKFISVSATNFGPGDVTLSIVCSRNKRTWRFWRRPALGVLVALQNPTNPSAGHGVYAGGLPKKIATGEQFSAYLTAAHEGLAENPIARVGFSDTFGRFHWASKADVAKTREAVRAYLHRTAQDRASP